MSKTDLSVPRPKRIRRRVFVFVITAILFLGGATALGLAWFNEDQASQEQARAADAQRVKDEASKQAELDAHLAKLHAEEAQKSAARTAAAAAAANLASQGWKKAAIDIYTADIPGGYRCTRLACNQFLVMTTAATGCPHGILIRGRWLQGEVVTGPVTKITGPMLSGEQAAVEVLDYTGAATSLDLTEFRCT